MLTIIKLALMSMLRSHIYLMSYSRPPYSRPMMSHHVTCHVTTMSHASLSSKRKEKQNPYKIRKIK